MSKRSRHSGHGKGDVAEAKDVAYGIFCWAAGEDPSDCHNCGALSLAGKMVCVLLYPVFLAVNVLQRSRLFVVPWTCQSKTGMPDFG